MTPSTRSGGAPPQDRVYHHTPAKQQSHFPSRRTTVRVCSNKASKNNKDQKTRNGNVSEETDDSESSRKRRLKQATLTQIDFVPRSTADIVVEMSDSEDEKQQAGGDDKENQHRGHDIWAVPEDSDEEDAPVPSGRKRVRPLHGTANTKNKRRRTLGDERNKAAEAKSQRGQRRRSTLGNYPDTLEEKEGGYHTQTLTQLLGQRTFIKDSDDEGEESEGFEQWLKVAGEASPRHNGKSLPQAPSPDGHRQNKPLKSAMKNTSSSPAKTDREGSVVLQTPAKKIHFEIPSSSQLSTPCTAMMERYGPIGAEAEVTPSKKGEAWETADGMHLAGRKAMHDKIVIADSYDTESWGSKSTNGTQAGRVPLGRLGTPIEEDEGEDGAVPGVQTPTKVSKRADGGLTDRSLRSSPSRIRFPSKKPLVRTRSGQSEIPDSDDEGGFDYDDEGQIRRSQEGYIAGAETQLIMAELANVDSDVLTPLECRRFNVRTDSVKERDDRGKENVPLPSTRSSPGRHSDGKGATDPAKTPKINPPLAPPSSHEGEDRTPHGAGPAPDGKSQATCTPSTVAFIPSPSYPLIRQPLHLPSETDTFTQPMESQRVPASILQSLPQPGGHTDVVIPISHDDLQMLIHGYSVSLVTPSAVLTSVRRFWLLESDTLRYVASADAELGEVLLWERGARKDCIDYPVEQVYELNNVLTGNDLREEGLIPPGEMRRHKYLPPAVVSRYLWNLRHALFLDMDEQLKATQAYLLNRSVRDKADQASTTSDQIIKSSPPQQHDKPKVPTPSISDSQQIENQLQSESTHYHGSDEILVPSTPDDEQADQTLRGHSKAQMSMPAADSKTNARGTLFNYQKINQASGGRKQASFPRPSQATTASQVSSPSQPAPAAERRSTVDLTFPEAIRTECPPKMARSSSIDRGSAGEEESDTPKAGLPDSSIYFATYQASLIPLPESIQLGSSQAAGLLSKSQMLPDSLLRDEDYAGPM